jgi:hypothetical protein
MKHHGKRVWVFLLHGKFKVCNRGKKKDTDVLDSINFVTISGKSDYDLQGRSSDNMAVIITEL